MPKTPAAPAPEDAPNPTASTIGKGRATPSRAEQEAARKRPLVPDTKEAKAAAKATLTQQRERARIGMAAGEEKYLPLRDRGPQRRFARDFVDAGWHVGELILPAVVVLLITTFFEALTYAYFALWILVLFIVIDMVITSVRVKRAARRKFGETRLEKGLGWYAAMRTIQMRFMRLPKPQVKRGEHPA